jgi:hypothetical protein
MQEIVSEPSRLLPEQSHKKSGNEDHGGRGFAVVVEDGEGGGEDGEVGEDLVGVVKLGAFICVHFVQGFTKSLNVLVEFCLSIVVILLLVLFCGGICCCVFSVACRWISSYDCTCCVEGVSKEGRVMMC